MSHDAKSFRLDKVDLECDEECAQVSVWAIQERHAGGGWSSIGKGTLSVASQRRVDFEIICTERVGFSLIRASEQFDELSLSRFFNGREQGGHRQVQGLARPSCCPNAHPSVPCRVATSRVLFIFRCTPVGVANSTSLATTKHRARRVGAKGLSIIGTVDSSEHSSDS